MNALIDRFETATVAIVGWAGAAAWRRTLALLILALALFLPGATTLPVTDRDEARFAQATKQMLETGDYVDIRFQDEPRWKKPVGIYWLQSVAVAAAGGPHQATIAAYRAPSLAGAVAAAVLVAWAFSPLIGGPAAFLAGAITAATALTAAEANIAKTDAMLLATVALVMGAYIRQRLNSTTAKSYLLWAALAFGVLLKGPVVFGPLLGAIVWQMVAERSLAPLRDLGWRRGPILFLILAAPWFAVIAIKSGGAFFTESLVTDLIGKMAAGQEKHGAPPGYYLATVWAVFWPWAPLLLMAAPLAWLQRGATEVQLLTGWALPLWLVLEATPTKLPHYILPLIPALAALIALWLTDQMAAPAGRWRSRLAAGLFALVGGALALANLAGPTALEGAFVWQGAALGLVGGLFVYAGARALLAARRAGFVGAALLSALCLIPATLHYTIPALESMFPSRLMAAAAAPFRSCSAHPVASVGYHEPSLVFLEGTGTILAGPEDGAALLAANAGAMVWVEDRQRAEFDAAAGDTPLRALAIVDAFNPNRGKPTRLTLFAHAEDACLAERTR